MTEASPEKQEALKETRSPGELVKKKETEGERQTSRQQQRKERKDCRRRKTKVV